MSVVYCVFCGRLSLTLRQVKDEVKSWIFSSNLSTRLSRTVSRLRVRLVKRPRCCRTLSDLMSVFWIVFFIALRSRKSTLRFCVFCGPLLVFLHLICQVAYCCPLIIMEGPESQQLLLQSDVSITQLGLGEDWVTLWYHFDLKQKRGPGSLVLFSLVRHGEYERSRSSEGNEVQSSARKGLDFSAGCRLHVLSCSATFRRSISVPHSWCLIFIL